MSKISSHIGQLTGLTIDSHLLAINSRSQNQNTQPVTESEYYIHSRVAIDGAVDMAFDNHDS